jgi:citrate/tricarballylate utilization protein
MTLFDLAAFTIGFLRFWRDIGEPLRNFAAPQALRQAIRDAVTLRYLDGGGDGCPYPRENFSMIRRRYHHFTVAGFTLCLASTTTAAFYETVLGWKAPYSFASLPVALGTAGGAALMIGTLGLLWLKGQRDTALVSEKQNGMDIGFLVLLLFAAITGLLLLTLRETAAMGVLLAFHLAGILALFLTMPYGKFVHAIYRFAALVRFHLENERSRAALAPK